MNENVCMERSGWFTVEIVEKVRVTNLDFSKLAQQFVVTVINLLEIFQHEMLSKFSAMQLSERGVFMVESRYHQEKGERTTLAGWHSIRLVY